MNVWNTSTASAGNVITQTLTEVSDYDYSFHLVL